MIRFLHEGTRLYTHTTRAYRIFTNPKEIDKWHLAPYDIVFEKGGAFEITGEADGVTITSKGTTFVSYEREEQIILNWQDDYQFKDKAAKVEIRIFPATSETEYCTEIHVVHNDLSELDEEMAKLYKTFWKNTLEHIRRSVNGDWVIQDSELTLDCFK